jgi:nicotinamidase/pyrazinamidase
MMPVFSRAGVSRINASAVERDVLIIIDPQVDFCPGGALAVRGGDEIVPTVNQLARDFPHIVLTRDWHPPGTTFSSAPTLAGFKTIEVDYGAQTLWPDHCVQGTKQNGQRRPKRH